MIYTSYFGNKEIFNNPNIFPVSIALYPPKEFVGKSYRPLAPEPSTLRDWKRDHSIGNYNRDFSKVLARLDPSDVIDQLLLLSGT